MIGLGFPPKTRGGEKQGEDVSFVSYSIFQGFLSFFVLESVDFLGARIIG